MSLGQIARSRKLWRRRSAVWLTAAGLLTPCAGSAAVDLTKLPPPATRRVDFAKDIEPLFQSQCLKCHGPDKQKGGLRLDGKESALKGGDNYAPAIRPGKSAESPLIHFVAGLVPDMEMPQKGDPLTLDQIGMLRAWIDQGADWPEAAKAAAETHWSFKAVLRPSTPETTNLQSQPADPIDAFIQAKLASQKLALSPRADRRTLIRRLYFDLLGLPPTPEQVRAFEQDKAPDAYRRLVEELLASPHYGERWARHWLDVVRFAETTGFEVNTPRPDAWPYRDYVIRTFNEDRRYDRFILEQLAGDVLGEDAGTGFLVAGPDDLVKSPDPVLTANQRADELHDMVSTTGSTFLGLTVGCARCHNHKFDPIPQTNYYSLKAIFKGVRHGERKMKMPEAEADEKELAERRARLAVIDAKLTEFEPLALSGPVATNHLRSPVQARQNVERVAPMTARKLRFTISRTTDAEPCIDELEVYTAGPDQKNIALASAGTRARASSVFPNSELHRLEHLNDGRYGNSRSWISNERGKGWVELEFPEPVTISRVVWGRDREQKYSDRLALVYQIEVAASSNDWHIIASSADRQPYVPGTTPKLELPLAGLTPAESAEAKKLAEERAEQAARIAKLSRVPMIYGGTFEPDPTPTYRLSRGDPMQPREAVEPGALGIIPVKFTLKDASEPMASSTHLTENQRRRLALAHWIIDPANPLTVRVIVNRIWQYHFGEGLVNTPSDFGANGARPSHPELLDWLAAEFMSPTWSSQTQIASSSPLPWSIKHLHRLIVNSAVYRQASDARPDCLAVDAGSRLLWRFPPRRLEAEVLRDMILAVSGKLDLRMGGPGFSFFEPNDNYVRVYSPKQEYGPTDWRRMVYGTVVRQRPDGVFGAFDCPDGGQIAPKRNRSTTPLQALNLLNSGFTMQQANFLAQRLEKEAGQAAETQVQRAFALALQREPDADELAAAAKLVREQGLMIFCRALLNANEFVYVF